MTARRLVLLALLSVVAASRASADDDWVPIGPDGGAVRRFAVDPGTPGRVLALSNSPLWPLFESSDGGLSWAATGDGLEPSSALAFAPSAPATLYLGGGSGQVFRSTDGGGTFAAAGAPLPGLDTWEIRSLAVHPLDPAYVLAGTYGGHGIFRSTDGGETWSDPETSGLPWTIFDLAWDPAVAGTVYACGGSAVVFSRSTDAGVTWTAGGGISVPGTLSAGVSGILVEPGSPTTLRALVVSWPSGAGWYRTDVVRSTDGGESWSAAAGPSAAGFGLRLLGDGPRLVTLQQVPSTTSESPDSGEGWTTEPVPEPLFTADAALVPGLDAPRAILVGGILAGPLRRATPSSDWETTSGFRVANVLDFASRGVGGRLFASTGARLARSDDRGATWDAVESLPIPAFWGVEIDRDDPNLVLATGVDALVRSTDSGTSWSVSAIDLDKQERFVQITATSFAGTFLAATSLRLLRSTDAGLSWVPALDFPDEQPTAAAAGPGAVVYLAVYLPPLEATLFRSGDGGASWTPTALADGVAGVAVHPGDSDRLFVTGSNGLQRSTDGGATWTSLPGPVPGDAVQDPHVDATGRLWVGVASGGLWSSHDGGASWRSEGFAGVGVAVVGSSADALYARAAASGAFRRDVPLPFFADGFESGDAGAWSATVP